MLQQCEVNDIYIPIFEDPETVLHQSLLEIYKLADEQAIFFGNKTSNTYREYFKYEENPYIENLFY